MSEIADCIYNTYIELFPHWTIIKEKFVSYKGYRLFFDFFIREIGLYTEVQGEQHSKFNKHFFKTIDDFRQQQVRDNLKIEYIQNDRLKHLIRFYHNEDISKALVVKKFNAVFDVEDGIVI